MALTKLITDLIDGSLGTDWQATPKTADFTAVAGEGYFVNTTSTAITVTLPSSPSVGDEVILLDYAANAATNNITITSSNNIEGASDDLVLSTDKVSKTLVYSDATKGWLVANEVAGVAAPLTVDYLVVAGGGGAGYYAGAGGGGGGLRTSYSNSSSLNGHNETALSLSRATNYSVSIGGGGSSNGSSVGTAANYGGDGTNTTFSTITSTGGGGGSGGTGAQNGRSGGSGGGGSRYNSGTAIGGAAVTSPVTQGHSGGGGNTNTSGAGGGAGAAGVDNNNSGGSGLSVNILNTTNASTASVGEVSGSDVYFAGGGGGYSGGTGGIGGGGDATGSASATGGLPNTGGGAGGDNGAQNKSGGSGVVILRYPSEYAITVGSGIIEASGSPFTESTEKVSVFTGGTGIITFAEA